MNKLRLILILLFPYATFAQGSWNMDSLFNWQNPSLPASAAHVNVYNEIWGYAKHGKEYAIIGSTMGTHIIDVTDPSQSQEVVFIEGAQTGPVVVHRDYHDYDDYLYMVCDEGNSTLQIADLRFLPDSAPIVYDDDAIFSRSHNIFIDSSSARMYVCGGNLFYAVVSLENPTSPTLILNCPTEVPFWSSVGYVHDTYVRGDTAYLNSETRGLFVVDFSDINNPEMLGSLDFYVQSGYNHSGWLMADKPYYAMADETHGMDMKIVDVSDFSDMQVTDTIGSNTGPFAIPHNLIYKEDMLYVSHYFDGVYSFDCTDAAHPVVAGYYDTSTEVAQDHVYRGCWGVYPFLPSGNILASDMQTGLWVLRSNYQTGVDELNTGEPMGVFPNPAYDHIYLTKSLTSATFELFNPFGQLVSTGTVAEGGSIDVSVLTPGVHILKLQSQEGTFITKVLKR
jgi:choice-of-anchor B domain-containing protein